MATPRIPHVVWRDGRPRFQPGPKLRALGYKGMNLKTADRWMTYEEAAAWIAGKQAEIAARRARKAAGQRLRPVAGMRAPVTVEDLFEDFWKSRRIRAAGEPGALARNTVADYRSKARVLSVFDPELYAGPAAALGRGVIKGLHEALWEEKGLPMANGVIAVLRLVYSHAVDRERVAENPCLRLRLPPTAARVRVGTPAEIAALVEAADAGGEPEIADAIVLALYTGQRQADVLALSERTVEHGRIRFIQAKTGARVRVRALQPLTDRLAAARECKRLRGWINLAEVVIDGRAGRPFNKYTFRHRFADVRATAAKACPSVAGLLFLDLRDTAVTRLALAGCSLPEIAGVTGHSLKTIHTILKHYLELGEAHADAAMDKLADWLEKEEVAL